MDVSIIIVNYNTSDLTLKCIESILKQTKFLDFEVILVDNASTDGSCESIRRLFPKTTIIESNENIGFGRANNLAIQNSTGKYIFLLNSDTILLNNAIFLFYKFMEENNTDLSIGAIGGILLDIEERPTSSYGTFPTIQSEFNYIRGKFIQIIDRKLKVNNLFLKDNQFINVDFITGADLFIPKAIINEIGAFDPQFFMYYEETDLQKRMYDHGFKRLIINGPRIIHLEGKSISSSYKFSYSRFLLSQKSLHIYMDKHFTGLRYILFRFFMILIRSTIIFDHRFNFHEKVKIMKLIFSR